MTIISARTTSEDDVTAIEIKWRAPPDEQHVTARWLVRCEGDTFRQLLYLPPSSTRASCRGLSSASGTSGGVNVTVAYVTPLGGAPAAVKRIAPEAAPIPGDSTRASSIGGDGSVVVREEEEDSIVDDVEGDVTDTVANAVGGGDFLSTPAGVAVIAVSSLALVILVVALTCYIRKRKNPKFRDRAGGSCCCCRPKLFLPIHLWLLSKVPSSTEFRSVKGQ